MPRGKRKSNVALPDLEMDNSVGHPPDVPAPVRKSWTVTMIFDAHPEVRYSVEALTGEKARTLANLVIHQGFTVELSDGSMSTTYPAHRVLRVEVRSPDA